MRASRISDDRHVVVVGAGGNIGSHLVPHLARMPEIARLTLIDRDRYERHNVANQAITAASIGRAKARVQARVARRINPRLEVRAIGECVEAVPMGLLRADLILACLDSRRSRQYVNEAARRLGVPWIDAGVLADGLLARIDTYLPGPDAPCLECGWDAHDYAAIEQTYSCEGVQRPASSNAPASLGALAAALQALECARLLSAAVCTDSSRRAEQVVIGVSDCCHYRTTRLRNPACRLGAHDAWSIEPLAMDLMTTTLRTLFEAMADRVGSLDGIAIRVEGKSFVRAMSCTGCDTTRLTLRVSTAAGIDLARCARCHSRLVVAGLGITECIERDALAARELRRTLRSLGMRAGDVISAESSMQNLHFELSDSDPEQRAVPDEPAVVGAYA